MVMKLGISTYSFVRAIQGGTMSVLDIFDFAKENGAVHVEVVPIGFSLTDPEVLNAIVRKSNSTGVAISNYAVGGNLLQPNEEAFEKELKRLEGEVDIARQLGVTRMRHDIAWRAPAEATSSQFEADFPRLVDGCQRVADYAAQYGIVTSIENHGFHVQASDRVLRIVEAVGRPNFRTTLDTGNFLVIDEDPAVIVPRHLPFASMVHLKDFYYRKFSWQPSRGWGRTAGGRYYRGSIFGCGDLDTMAVLRALRDADYDGFVSIEFEGIEDPHVGTLQCLENAQAIWTAVKEEAGIR